MTQNIEQRTLAATATMEGAAKAVDEIAHKDADVITPVGTRKSFPKISREWNEESTRLKDEWGSESQRLQTEWNNDSATLRQDWQNERNELSTKALGVKPWESGVSETNINQQRRWDDGHTYLPKTVPAVMEASGPDDNWIPYTADKSDTLNDVFGRKPIDLVIGIILVPDAKFNYPKLYALGKVWELDDGDQHLTVKDFSETADEHLIITLDDDSLIIAGKVVAASRNYVNELTGIRQKALSGGTKQLDLKRGQYGQQADGVDRVSLDNDTYWFAWDSPSGVVRNFVVNNDYGTATMVCELDDASIAYFEFVSPTIDKLREQGDIRGFGAIFGGEEYCDDAIAKAFENSVKTGRIVAPKGYVARCANAILHTFSATDRVDVSLECSFIFESQDGFDIRGLQNSEFKLGLVSYLSLDTNDSEVSPGCGIAISSFWSTKVDIQESRNFLVGNKLIGGNLTSGSGNGMAFNDVLIRNAKAPRVPGGVGCLVTTVPVGSKPGYFNENKLKLGFLRGERGVFFKKGDLQTDPFNGNKLLYPQIELAEKQV
ncbi:hypothetical protein ACBZ91_06555 [Vibrio natriegens]|uniref:hypothetical protein n=1 Tax=Vibrio natriegens TaxID=691 RepID=UPI003557C237